MEVTTQQAKSVNPFPGLRPFGIHDSALFFGREKHVNDVILKLFANRFVSIVGSSGSGKSSLVHAGILPLVKGCQNKFSNAEWKVIAFHPGSSPLENFADAISAQTISGPDESTNTIIVRNEILSILKESPIGLIEVVRKYFPEGQHVFILADQFEELFRFMSKEKNTETANSESKRFVQLLTEAIQQRDVSIYIMITIRADFLGDCSQFQGLPEAINDGQYLVPQLNQEQIKSVIIKPVEMAKGKITPRLVHQLLNDFQDRQDQLPILQHAMMRAWDKWTSSSSNQHPIDLEEYESIGTMSKALSHHADEVYNSLTERQKKLSEIIFKTLTVKGSDNRGIRRPTALKKIFEIADSTSEEIIAVLDEYRSAGRLFITPPIITKLNDNSIIDISHESLMRIWERLEKWVDEEYQSALLYDRISESAGLYEEGKAALWRDPELQFALDWKVKNNPNKSWASQYNSSFEHGMHFLEISLQERNSEIAGKKKRRVLTNIFITTFFVACTLLTMWALQEKKSQELSTREAEIQKLSAEKNAISEREARTEAELKSKEANEQRNVAEVQTAEAKKQAELAKQSENVAKNKDSLAREALRKSEQDKTAAIESKNLANQATEKAEKEKKEKERLRILKVAQNMALQASSKFEDNQLPALLAVQAYQFNKENNGFEQDAVIFEALQKGLISLSSKNIHSVQTNSEFSTIQINLKNDLVTAASIDGSLFNVDKGKFVFPSIKNIDNRKNSIINIVCLNSDGRLLATGYDDFRIVVSNLSGSGSNVEFIGSAQLMSLAFSNDNKFLVSGGRDGSISVWETSTSTSTPFKKLKQNSIITSVVFLNQEPVVIAGMEDGTLLFWNYKTNESSTISCGNNIVSLSCTETVSDKSIVAAGLSNGNIKLFTTQNLKASPLSVISNISVRIEKICFSENAKFMAVASADKLIRIYSLEDLKNKPITINAGNTKIRALVFGQNDRLYASSANNKVMYWEIRSNEIAEIICSQLKRNFTKEEWQTLVDVETPYRKTCIK